MKKLSIARVIYKTEIVSVAGNNGWQEAIAHRMELDGHMFAIVVSNERFNVIDDESGFLLLAIQAPIDRFSTKLELINFIGSTIATTTLETLEKHRLETGKSALDNVARLKVYEEKHGVKPQAKAFRNHY